MDEREDLVVRIAELDGFIKKDQEERAKLKHELRMYDYNKRFNEVTKNGVDGIPWDRLCWPVSSNGGLPDQYICIVCRKGFKRFHGRGYHSGSYIGGGFGQPDIHVHDECMPFHVRRREIENAY